MCFVFCIVQKVHRISSNADTGKWILSFKGCELPNLLETASSYASFAVLKVEIHCLGTRDNWTGKHPPFLKKEKKKPTKNKKPLLLKIFLAAFDTTRHCYLYLHMSKLPLLISISVVSYHLEKHVFWFLVTVQSFLETPMPIFPCSWASSHVLRWPPRRVQCLWPPVQICRCGFNCLRDWSHSKLRGEFTVLFVISAAYG